MTNTRGPEVDVAQLFSSFYLPETTFAQKAVKVGANTALVTHTLTPEQCNSRKTAMLYGMLERKGDILTNTRRVSEEINRGHFIDFELLAAHQGFGMLLAAGNLKTDSIYQQMWWTEVKSINWQSPATTGDEMVAKATLINETPYLREFNGRVLKGGVSIHTRARGVKLEDSSGEDFTKPHLPHNAWLEVAAHFAGGAIAALEKFPTREFAVMYLGVGNCTLPKELGLPGDNLEGITTLDSVEELEVPDFGKLYVFSSNVEISKGTAGRWNFNKVELGFASKERLIRAIEQS